VLEILTYSSTLRFLCAVLVQTAFNNDAYWNRLEVSGLTTEPAAKRRP